MYCSKCGCEYLDGFTECSDCHIPLLAGNSPEDATERPDLGLVVVMETNDRIQLSLVKGLLEDAGIPYYILGQIAMLIQDVDPFLHKWVRVQVPRDREAEARQLLEDWRHAEPVTESGEKA